MQPSCRFLGNYWARVLGLLRSPLGALTSFPLYFSWGDWRHLHKVHYLATYLGNWAFVAPIITTIFFLNYRLFLLGVIGFLKINLFLF
jgi:hypothetical protein